MGKIAVLGICLLLLGNGAAAKAEPAVKKGNAVNKGNIVLENSDLATDDGALYEKKATGSKLGMEGSLRYLYGQGHLEGKVPVTGRGRLPFKELMVLQTLRTRLYANYNFDKQWKFITGVEDNRVLNEQSQTDTVHIFRAFLEGTYSKSKYRAGRFGYKVTNGNVLDGTVDGVRLGFGPAASRISFFWGRIGESFNRREGYIVDTYKEWAKWYTAASYFDFKNYANPQSDWNRQKVFTATLGYKFTDDISLSWEYLQAAGSDRGRDVTSEHGYVWNLNYKEYDYKKPGSFRLLLRYYRQPQASVFTHTMSAWPGFFNMHNEHLGFEGVGLCFDYVLRKGVLLTLEGYDLSNYQEGRYLSDFHQKVLGGSITFGF